MKSKQGVLLLLFLAVSYLSTGQDYQTKIKFDVSEDAVNNFIHNQNIPRSFQGTTNGYEYGVAANVALKFTDNNVSARLVVSGSVIDPSGNKEDLVWIVNPDITFYDSHVTINGIEAFIDNVPNLINQQNGPQFLKDIIIQAYDFLIVQIYPGSLLQTANEQIPTFLDIEVTNIGLGWQALDKKIRFTATIHSTVNSPVFTISGARQDRFLKITYSSTVETQINELAIYSLGGSLVWSNTNLSGSSTYHIPKGESISVHGYCQCASGYYIVRALFDSPLGWYEIERTIGAF